MRSSKRPKGNVERGALKRTGDAEVARKYTRLIGQIGAKASEAAKLRKKYTWLV